MIDIFACDSNNKGLKYMNTEKESNKLAEQVKDIVVHKLNQAAEEGYIYAAFDKDGRLYVYKEEPIINEDLEQWKVVGRNCKEWETIFAIDSIINNWKETCTEISKLSYINWEEDRQDPNDRIKHIRGFVKKNGKHLFDIMYGLDHCNREYANIRCIVDDKIDITYVVGYSRFKTMPKLIEHCKKIAEDFYKSQIVFAKDYL